MNGSSQRIVAISDRVTDSTDYACISWQTWLPQRRNPGAEVYTRMHVITGKISKDTAIIVDQQWEGQRFPIGIQAKAPLSMWGSKPARGWVIFSCNAFFLRKHVIIRKALLPLNRLRQRVLVCSVLNQIIAKSQIVNIPIFCFVTMAASCRVMIYFNSQMSLQSTLTCLMSDFGAK